MEPIAIKNAYYVKLGRGGKYVESSIRENKLRFGWDSWPVEEINQRNWVALKEKFQHEHKKGIATRIINSLKTIVESTSDDVWITFHASHLYWCRVDETVIEQDSLSKFCKVAGEWCKCDIENQPLIISQIPGILSKTQGFQGTICNLGEKEVDTLRRLINNQPSETFQKIESTKADLIKQVRDGLCGLYWKDFETLVDLIFHNAGWRRVSLVGEMMEDIDLILEEPITRSLYAVQVKSDAQLAEFEKYAKKFSKNNFKTSYFVVHNKSKDDWPNPPVYEDVELILQERLAELVVDAGLVNWLLTKIK